MLSLQRAREAGGISQEPGTQAELPFTTIIIYILLIIYICIYMYFKKIDLHDAWLR